MCVLYLHFIISFYFMYEIILYLKFQAYFPRSPSMGSSVGGARKDDTISVVSSNLILQRLWRPPKTVFTSPDATYNRKFLEVSFHLGHVTALCAHPTRPKARGLTQHGGPYRTVPLAVDRRCPAASWCGFKLLLYNKCTQPSVMSYGNKGRHCVVFQFTHALSLFCTHPSPH